MTKPDPNHDRDSDHSNNHHKEANDNNNKEANDNKRVVASVPAGGALTSLTALGKVLNSVDTASVRGRSKLPLMQFKSREDGTWMFGQRRTLPEDGSRWAVNVATFEWGYICFDPVNKKKVLDERLVSVGESKPDLTELPDRDAPWQEEWAVNLKCISGADAGVEVAFKISTVGGTQAIAGLIDTVRDRLNGGQHDGKVVPIVILERDSYPHPEHGRVWTPVLTVVDWMPLGGPAPAPTPTSPPEQPRRRRVA
jgi:hypothetical protein